MISVDAQTIEEELRALWKSDTTDGGQPAMTRICTLNLVICAQDARRAAAISQAVQSLTASHPNRTVMVLADPHPQEAQLNAWVQANCVLTAPGVPQVCDEQITIEARGAVMAQAANLTLSLLLPDLPVVLYAPGPTPMASSLVERLRSVTDRIIVDSADFHDPINDLPALSEVSRALDQQAHRVSLSDLSWARLTPWRELIAQFFDTRPLLNHLYRLDRVEIEFGGETRALHVQSPLLLASWLATRLGWQFEGGKHDGEGMLLRFERAAFNRPAGERRPVAIALQPLADVPPGTITAVRMRCLDYTRAEFMVERTADPDCIETTAHIEDQTSIRRLTRLAEPDLADLLASELRLHGPERTFHATLNLTGEVAMAIG